MMENPSLCDVGTHFLNPFSKSVEYFAVVVLVNGSSGWNELPMDQPTTVEEADEHDFHLGLVRPNFFGFGAFGDNHCGFGASFQGHIGRTRFHRL